MTTGTGSLTVAVAVITYRRPGLLGELLASLQTQQVRPDWCVRIVVVDNDPEMSARPVVAAASGPLPIQYGIEPEPGIPFARERSVRLARDDDAVIFVDDDETTPPGWLETMVGTWLKTAADIVTGPVHGILPEDAPAWARHSDVYSSVGKHRTGDLLDKAYTNNTLVSQRVLNDLSPAFHPAFRHTGSSDLHFFLRAARAGYRIVWVEEAVVQETVPVSRVSLAWLVRRAFRSGAGDTISRRLIRPGFATWLKCLGLGVARMGSGVVLVIAGVVEPAARIKGLRRIVSGIGSLAGLLGINHDEYRR